MTSPPDPCRRGPDRSTVTGMARALRFDPAELRRAYVEAGEAVCSLVATIDPSVWDGPGLGGWSVRDLVGHAGRSFVTVTTYLRSGAGQAPTLDHPLDYALAYRMVAADLAGVEERGREAGRALAEDPAASMRTWFDEARAALDAHDDDAPAATLVGVMRLADYLPCRVLELVVHAGDIARALGVTVVIPDDARGVATTYAAGLAAESEHADQVLLALTGRGTLEEPISVV